MPLHEEHCKQSLQLYGIRGDDIHTWIDETSVFAGGHHRRFRHNDSKKNLDLICSIFIKNSEYNNNEELIKNIALSHFTLDGIEYKKGRRGILKYCPECGKEHPKIHQKYCSQECYFKAKIKTPKFLKKKICKKCNKEYTPKFTGQRYCDDCKNKYSKQKYICKQCGKEFEYNKSRTFCSSTCAANYASKIAKVKRDKIGENVECLICKKIFYLPKYKKLRCCSPKCKLEYKSSNLKSIVGFLKKYYPEIFREYNRYSKPRSKNFSPWYKMEEIIITKKCIVCNKEYSFSRYPHRKKFCSDKCQDKYFRQTHPEECRKYHKKCNLKHKEQRRKHAQEYYQNNKQHYHLYYQNNKSRT